MSEGFRLSKDLILPRNVATKVISIVAKREAGKTYNADVLIEEMVKSGIPIVIIDGMGTHWGLRVAVKYKDGKQVPDPDKPGLPIVVFGGDHADIPLPMMQGKRRDMMVPDPEKIKLMATSIVESGISAVIDTSDIPSDAQARTIVVEFVTQLQRANRNYGVRVVVLEEAELWAPQNPMRDEVMCLHVMNNLVKRGGNFNLGCVMLTQRAASFNKNLLTQSDILFVGRLIAPQDKAAIQDWVKKATETEASRKEINKWYDGLNELAPGEMWVWKPDPPKIRVLTKFRLRETLHATREFLQSPEARTVKPGDVEEYKRRFLKIFAPPPKLTPIKTKLVAAVPYEPAPEIKLSEPLTIVPGQPVISEFLVPALDPEPVPDGAAAAVVQVREPVAGVRTRLPTLRANDQEVTGQLLYAMKQGAFDERQTLPKTIEILGNYGWLHPRQAVDAALLKLCDLKFFTRKISSGNMFWYTLTPNAKERIVLEGVNAI